MILEKFKKSSQDLKWLLFFVFIVIFIFVLSRNAVAAKSNTEHFANDTMYAYAELDYSNYQTADLTANDTLLVGQAERYIYMLRGKPQYKLDVYANLYTPPNGIAYTVSLNNKNSKRDIGNLKRDGDGVFKLHFVSDTPELWFQYNEIEITGFTEAGPFGFTEAGSKRPVGIDPEGPFGPVGIDLVGLSLKGSFAG